MEEPSRSDDEGMGRTDAPRATVAAGGAGEGGDSVADGGEDGGYTWQRAAPLPDELADDEGAAEGEDDERIRLAAELTRILFPVLLEIYSASAGPGVRHAALQAMLRMVVSSEAELLAGVLQPAFLASQVAAMLSSQDLKIIVAALQLSETLLAKLPDLFSVHFRREGVLHQVQKLTDPGDRKSVV